MRHRTLVSPALFVIIMLAFVASLGLTGCGAGATSTPAANPTQGATTPAEVATMAPTAAEASVPTAEAKATAAPSEEATAAVAPTTAGGKKVKITFWRFGSDDLKLADGTLQGDWFRSKVVEPFMKANPNIEVDFAMKGFQEGGTTLFIDTAFASGQPPDVYSDALFRLAKYANKGLSVPLDPILTAEKRATFDPSWVPAVTHDGKQWGILLYNTFPDAMLVNRALFKDAGALDLLPKEPDRDWTTGQFEKALAAITKAPGRYGTAFFAKTPSYDHAMFAYLAQFGARRFNPGDYTKVIDNSPEAAKALTWMKGLLDKGLVVPGPAGLADEDVFTYLLSGGIGVSAGGWYELGLVQAGEKDGSLKTAFDPYLVNYPYPSDGKPGPLCNLGGEGYTVFKSGDADREAAALKFVDFATTPALVAEYMQQAGAGMAGLPMLNGVDTDKLYANDADAQWILRMAKERGTVDLGYAANNFNQVRDEWVKLRQAVWGGDESVENALAAYEKKADEWLAAKQ